MIDYQERVIDEKRALDEKIEKLDFFCGTDTFKQLDVEEQARMFLQRKLMQMYSEVLGDRIEAFKDDGK